MAKEPDNRGGRDISEAEADLWRRVTADAKRLDRRKRTPSTQPRPATSTSSPANTAGVSPAKAGRTPSTPTPPSYPPLPELGHDAAPGLDKRTFDRLRRERVPIDSWLDLHGFSQEEAHRALHDFLASSQAAGRRCLLVITGKGSRGDLGTGVLRRVVPMWLNRPPNRSRVLAFCHATPQHGGEGALYVLLRRLK